MGLGAFSGLISCLAFFSGCGEQQGNRPSIASAVGGTSALATSGTGGGIDVGVVSAAGAGGADDCQRDVSLTAVTLGTPAPLDLVIVADDSQSLAWSRDDLSKGLGNLLRDVRGRDVRIFLLNPTQYGASSALAQEPLSGTSVVDWQDPATGKAYSNAMTTYVPACTDPSGTPIACPDSKGPTPFKVQGTWRFDMPAPLAVLRADMTDTEFAAEQAAVASAILAMGGTGSSYEQPLCTLSRYVSQAAALLPKNAVFLIISDEDDKSTPDKCLAGFTAELKRVRAEASLTPCTSNCDTYRYYADGDSNNKLFAFQCAAFDDTGREISGTRMENSASQGTPSCADVQPGACTADESKTVSTFCASGSTLVGCQRTCAASGAFCSVDLADASVNPCTQAFTKDGTKYANLAAYCTALRYGSNFHDCHGGGLSIDYVDSLSGSASRQPLMAGTTTADIANYFKTHADAAFATKSYLVEAIVLDSAFRCSLGAGQSYATNIASVVGDPKHLFPLCEPYAPALDGVLSFAQTLVQTSFPLSLQPDEHVTVVYVLDKSGTERELTSSQFTYDRATQTLNVQPTQLHASDSTLRVEVTSDCRPVVR